MAANTAPIFTNVPKISWTGNMTTGNNSYDGTNAAVTLLFTADASDGSFVQKITCKAAGTNIATVLRVWVNNGSTNGTASNNAFLLEFALPATTATATGPTVNIDIPVNRAVPASYRLYCVLGTTVAAGWNVIGVGGDY